MDLLKKLTSTFAPSGREGALRELLTEELGDCVDTIATDALGNLICHKIGSGKKLMLAAHMDEIGVIVTHVDEKGFLRFSNVGGVSPSNCVNRGVTFENGTHGVISYENKEKPGCGLDKMFIDIGNAGGIEIGDVAVFDGDYTAMGDAVASKALDNRAGCCALALALQNAKKCENDLYAVFTVQEELGLRGARTAAAAIEPDMGVSVDVSYENGTPESRVSSITMGEGAAIKLCDSSFVIHPAVREFLLRCAKDAKIKYQLETASYGGTDSGAIHLTGGGVPSGTISIPTRYIHSPREVCDMRDIKGAAELIRTMIETKID